MNNNGSLWVRVPTKDLEDFRDRCCYEGASLRERVCELIDSLNDLTEPQMAEFSAMAAEMPKRRDYSPFYVQQITDERKRRFKAWCSMCGLSMAKAITTLMYFRWKGPKQ